MDIAHVGHVLRAHWKVVSLGLVLCVLAALFVYGRPGWDGKPTMTARTPQEWSASSTLLLTQKGFPAGRANADPNQLSNLAVLYAEIAMSDPVRRLAEAGGKIRGEVTAEPVIYTIGEFSTPVLLPMVKISATAPTAGEALRDSAHVATALQRYVTSGQADAKIRPRDRVVIQTARSGRLPGSEPTLVSGPSKAVPIVIFALLTGLLLMAVFVYDNYRVHASDSSKRETPSPQPEAPRETPRLQPTAAPQERPQREAADAKMRRPRAVLSAESPRPDVRAADVPAVPRRRSK